MKNQKQRPGIRREAVFRCLTNLSIITGAISTAFIVFMALVLSRLGYLTSAVISLSLALLYLVYRIFTESG